MSTNAPQPDTDKRLAHDGQLLEAKPLGSEQRGSVRAELEAPRISVVVPCLNEEASIAGVVHEILIWARTARESIEIIVADNGSKDRSVELAEQAGARVVHVEERGYGSAIRGGIAHAIGEIVVIGDADGQHDFSEIGVLIEHIDNGCDMVIGSRFDSKADAAGSVPWLNRTIGAPILSAVGRLLSGTDVRDFHCGYRAITRSALGKVSFECDGMEFATEMIVKAAKARLTIGQCAVSIRPAGRDRPPHLRPFRDGLRHLVWMVKNR